MNLQKEFAKAKQLFDSDPNTNNANALYLAKEKLELLYEEKLQGIIICPKWELGSNDMKNKMAVKSTFRSSNPSESFQSKTFQFSLGKVC